MQRREPVNEDQLQVLEWMESRDLRGREAETFSVPATDQPETRREEGVVVLEAGGSVIYASLAFARLHALKLADLLGSNLESLYGAAAGGQLLQNMRRLEKERYACWQGEYRRQDGITLKIEANLIALSLNQDRPDHYVMMVREQPSAERAKPTAGESSPWVEALGAEGCVDLLFHALDRIQEALLIVDTEGRLQHANRSAQTLFGSSPSELIQRNVLELVSAADQAAIQNALTGSEETWVEEVTLQRRNGSKFLARVEIAGPRSDPSGSSRRVLACTDLSEWRLLEEELRQAQKLEAVGLLASGLAHNINSPLAAIMVTAEMAKAKHPHLREFQDILQAADRIQEIVANLMTKSRQEQSTEVVELDLNQLVMTELKFLEANLFFKHQVTLNVSLEPNLPKVRGLYSDFSQCFYNLVQNALDAMLEVDERALTVRTGWSKEDQALFFSVHDSGCGIAEANLNRIFKPFFTTKNEIHDDPEEVKPSGTGLGLSTTQYLMDKYGASIEVISQVGAGSEFVVTIPLTSEGESGKTGAGDLKSRQPGV